MTHDELKALLPWYAKGTLEESQQELVAQHLESCPDCTRELEEVGVFLSASEHLHAGAPDSSDDLLARTLQKISRHQHNQAAPRRWPPPLSLAASLMAAVVLGIVLFPTREATDEVPSFSTGGNPYQAELVFELLIDGELGAQEVLELMYFAS